MSSTPAPGLYTPPDPEAKLNAKNTKLLRESEHGGRKEVFATEDFGRGHIGDARVRSNLSMSFGLLYKTIFMYNIA